MSCIFCKFVNKEIPFFKVWENKKFLIFLDRNPINKGHMLLIPKSHTNEIKSFSYGNRTDLFIRSLPKRKSELPRNDRNRLQGED